MARTSHQPSVIIDSITKKKCRPQIEHTELEEELHERAHIDYDRVAIVSAVRVAAMWMAR